jgi:hypothetical protein
MLLQALKELEADGTIEMPAAASWERAGSPPLPKWVNRKGITRSTAPADHADVRWAPELGFWPELMASQPSALKAINDFLCSAEALRPVLCPTMLPPSLEQSPCTPASRAAPRWPAASDTEAAPAIPSGSLARMRKWWRRFEKLKRCLQLSPDIRN